MSKPNPINDRQAWITRQLSKAPAWDTQRLARIAATVQTHPIKRAA